MSEQITLPELVTLCHRSKSTILRKSGIESYFIGQERTNRGIVNIYDIKVLSLFGYSPDTIEIFKINRKNRNDRQKPRKGITSDMEKLFVDNAYNEYINQGARRDIQSACWRTARQLWSESWAAIFESPERMATYFYQKRIMRKDTLYTGYAHRQPSWEQQWEYKWKKQDVALINVPTMRYNILELGESVGIIGPGYGAATVFWLDDHVSDSFVRSAEKSWGEQPKGLYLIDGWTGMLLDMEPGEVTTQSTAILILRCVLKYGLPRIIGMENSRAMKSMRIEKIIEALYPAQLLADYRDVEKNYWLRQLFQGANSPIVRNIPNIPRFLFKARLEAWFKNIKYFDAINVPETYQAGGLDPVQLQLNSMPVKPTVELDEYYNQLRSYLDGEFLEKPRPAMFPGFAKRSGKLPTIANVWNYYGGNRQPGTGIAPDRSRIAELLYWLSDNKDNTMVRKTIVKAHPGRVSCTINNRPCWFVDQSLIHLRGQRIAIVTIPENLNYQGDQLDTGYAALFLVEDPEHPQFLNIVKNTYTTNVEEISENRAIVRKVRTDYHDSFVTNISNFEQPEQPAVVQLPDPVEPPALPEPVKPRINNDLNRLLEL